MNHRVHCQKASPMLKVLAMAHTKDRRKGENLIKPILDDAFVRRPMMMM